MANNKQHWDKVYATKSDTDVGWFQPDPRVSVELVEKYAQSKQGPIIDIGGGNSFLVKRLLDDGYSNLSVMDISDVAIERSKHRFIHEVEQINWMVCSVLDFKAKTPFSIWHDRAVFHFLTDDEKQKIYRDVASDSIKKDGFLIIGTFSESGPNSCSGLPIVQYSEETIDAVFNENFKLLACFDDVHITPSGSRQNFIWSVFQRK